MYSGNLTVCRYFIEDCNNILRLSIYDLFDIAETLQDDNFKGRRIGKEYFFFDEKFVNYVRIGHFVNNVTIPETFVKTYRKGDKNG